MTFIWHLYFDDVASMLMQHCIDFLCPLGVLFLKFEWIIFDYILMCLKNASRILSCADPDQTASFGSSLLAQAFLFKMFRVHLVTPNILIFDCWNWLKYEQIYDSFLINSQNLPYTHAHMYGLWFNTHYSFIKNETVGWEKCEKNHHKHVGTTLW